MIRLALPAAALMGVAAGPALAAPAQISLTLPLLAQVTGLTDIGFTGLTPTADAAIAQDVCAWTNAVTRSYTVTASGSGSGSAFTLANPDGRTVAYSVGWAGSPGAGSSTPLAARTQSTGFMTAALVPTCALGPTASATLRVTITAADVQAMAGGTTYTGTLTLLIAPA